MGYLSCLGSCVFCRRLFTFNPHRVPSVRVEGVREPVCLGCITRANELRRAKGLDPIVPLPGAYEAADEWGGDTWNDDADV